MLRILPVILACGLAAGCNTMAPTDTNAVERARNIALNICGVAPSAAELAKLWGADAVTVDKATLTGQTFCAAYLRYLQSTVPAPAPVDGAVTVKASP